MRSLVSAMGLLMLAACGAARLARPAAPSASLLTSSTEAVSSDRLSTPTAPPLTEATLPLVLEPPFPT
ncbi:MAG: hypothetical protein ACRDHY_08170, partial [Anaerolineales bacterium]